ncbi:MAG TPA: hypothetical protein VM821_05005 [Abditibacteriaceae bacterium]|nr:hypothetical protein [Abditibacteriaceae bacterium]
MSSNAKVVDNRLSSTRWRLTEVKRQAKSAVYVVVAVPQAELKLPAS